MRLHGLGLLIVISFSFLSCADSVESITQSSGNDNSSTISSIADSDGNTKVEVGSDDSISFDSAGSERMKIHSTGNIGIGTTAPSDKVEIYETGVSGSGLVDFLNLKSNALMVGDGSSISFTHNNDSSGSFQYASIGSVIEDAGDSDETGGIRILTSLTGTLSEAMRITGSGNVGIGTVSPTESLHFYGNSRPIFHRNNPGSATAHEVIQLKRSNSSGVGASGLGVRIGFYAESATEGTMAQPGQIEAGLSDATAGTADGYLAFRTTLNGTGAERMRIDSAGSVGIGTNAPASRLHIDASGAGGGLCVTSDGTCGAVPAGGEISAETTLNTGADYAEYFEAEEKINKTDLVGINPKSGKARRYRKGDNLIGVVSTDPGLIGNSDLANDNNSVLVALVGQISVNQNQIFIKNSKVFTKDNKPLGYLLSNGRIYINLSSADEAQNKKISKLQEQIKELKQLIQKKIN